MATISLTDPVAGTTVTAGLHAGNNAALRTAINGGLDNTNVAGGAAIDQTKLAFTAWTAYTPAWSSTLTQPVLNNGTSVGKYAQIGKTVICRAVVTMGTTTTFGTGSYFLSLPVTASASLEGLYGLCTFYDSSANAWYPGFALTLSGTVIEPVTNAAPVSPSTNAVPFTWATSDKLILHTTYEAA